MLELIACPRCKGGVVALAQVEWLVCQSCRLQYPVRAGVPIMLVEEALSVPTPEAVSPKG